MGRGRGRDGGVEAGKMEMGWAGRLRYVAGFEGGSRFP